MANLSMHVVDPETGCWEWTGAIMSRGYGSVAVGGGKTDLAHRVAWEAANGPVPDGLQIDHTCHNADTTCGGGKDCSHRRCVNPAHLEAVTQSENLRRALRRIPAREESRICARGHLVAGDNLRIIEKPSGRVERACVECKRDARRRAYARQLDRQGTPRLRRSKYDDGAAA